MTEIALGTFVLTAIVMVLSLAVLAARRVMQPSTPVTVTLNRGRDLTGTTGQTLLQILQAASVPIPSACAGAGTCGLCRVQLVAGGGAPRATETARLSRADLRGGLRLACQVVVRESLDIRLPDDLLAAESWRCAVASTRMLAPLIREIVLTPPEGARFQPRAGAFVQITAPPFEAQLAQTTIDPAFADDWQAQGWRDLSVRSDRPVTRAYSLANRPEDAGQAVLNIRLAVPPPGAPEAPPGIVSTWLFACAPGDAVDMSGPYGDFGARDTGAEMVLIGGGVGMAPLRAIIHDQLARGATRRIGYWFGARSLRDAFYHEEFTELAAEHPNFSYTLALSEPDAAPPPGTAAGFVHQVALRDYLAKHPAPDACEFYLCGPPLMIQATRAMLAGIGADEDKIFFDDFGG